MHKHTCMYTLWCVLLLLLLFCSWKVNIDWALGWIDRWQRSSPLYSRYTHTHTHTPEFHTLETHTLLIENDSSSFSLLNFEVHAITLADHGRSLISRLKYAQAHTHWLFAVAVATAALVVFRGMSRKLWLKLIREAPLAFRWIDELITTTTQSNRKIESKHMCTGLFSNTSTTYNVILCG